MEIRKTETPSRELLLLADEVEASVADYIGRGTCYAACDDGRIVGQYVLIHTRPFTAEVVNIAVVPDRQRHGPFGPRRRHGPPGGVPPARNRHG